MTRWGTVTPERIQDGSSNTIYQMEKSVDGRSASYVTQNGWERFWEWGGFTHGGDWPNMRIAGLPIIGDNQSRDPGNESYVPGTNAEFGFGSAHPGTVNASVADGSTHVFKATIDPLVHDQLGKREDGSTVGVEGQ